MGRPTATAVGKPVPGTRHSVLQYPVETRQRRPFGSRDALPPSRPSGYVVVPSAGYRVLALLLLLIERAQQRSARPPNVLRDDALTHHGRLDAVRLAATPATHSA